MFKILSKNDIVQRLVMHEGIRLNPYLCTEGYATIGVGRNLDTNPLTPDEKIVCGDILSGITKSAAFYLLRNDIDRVIKEFCMVINGRICNMWFYTNIINFKSKSDCVRGEGCRQ